VSVHWSGHNNFFILSLRWLSSNFACIGVNLFNFGGLLAEVAKDNLKESVVLTVFWVEYFAFFGSYYLGLTLTEKLKKRDFAGAIKELCLRINNINRQEPLLQVLSKIDVFI